MTANCKHRRGRKCTAKHFGGTPSLGVCGACPHREQVIEGPALVPPSALPLPIVPDEEMDWNQPGCGCDPPSKPNP